uniref:Eukaryotic translation initiation factor 3 subunit I n=1 Tax=Heterorhabditis bacteriophora TaxID=37862 RepID=A0A1I7XH07_HETBA
MRPLSLKGHDRALTRVRFNREGDLLFSAAKNKQPCVWFTENGERIGWFKLKYAKYTICHKRKARAGIIFYYYFYGVEINLSILHFTSGTYDGHNGVVWDIDVSWDTARLGTASGDNSVKLWDCERGIVLQTINTPTPAKSVNLSYSGNLLAFTTQKMTKNPSVLCVLDTRDDQQMTTDSPLFRAQFDNSATTCLFSSMDEKVTVGVENGFLLQYDMRNDQDPTDVNDKIHRYAITDLQLSPDGAFIISSSKDKTAALLDVNHLDHLKQYRSERPVNSACISVIRDHICLGGGEDAMQVTQTAVSAGHFEAKLYHMVFEEEFARFKANINFILLIGHFGPINTMAWHPSGNIIATGGEDGYVRVQELDDDYLEFKYDY